MRTKNIHKGDNILCYISGKDFGVFIGLLQVQSEAYMDASRIWVDDVYPCRLKVKALVTLPLEHAVPIRSLRDRLSIFESRRWGAHFLGSPTRLNYRDAEILADGIYQQGRAIAKTS